MSNYIIKKLPHILDVVVVVSNPAMYESRYRLFTEFMTYWSRMPDTRLWVVELALGDREFEVTAPDHAYHLRLRSRHEMWHKENLINLGVQQIGRLHPDWRKVAWIDADVQFADRHIVQSTLQQLEVHSIVQMFSHAQDLDFRHRPIPDEWGQNIFESFAQKHQARILDEHLNGPSP